MERSAGLVGYGRFGRSLADLLLDGGFNISALDPHEPVPENIRAADLADLAAKAGIIVLALPVAGLAATLTALRPHLTRRHFVLDVGSVKAKPAAAMAQILGGEIPWAATHPLFGPASIARGERPLRVVVCPNSLHANAARRARAFYEGLGCAVIEQTPEQHDAVMADTHALAFFVAKAMLESGTAEQAPFTPPSFLAMARTIDEVRGDAGHLFQTIENDNPLASGARRRLLDALSRIHAQLENAGESGAGAAAAPPLEIPVAEGPPPELRETREHIDELDEQLIRLLARRTRLAHHAALAKARSGRPVKDPLREQALLEQRRAWAAACGLSGDAIAEVFESILKFSRSEQELLLKRKSQ